MENQERKNNTEETKQEPQAPKMRWTAEQQRVMILETVISWCQQQPGLVRRPCW